jgi:hypothetical protein
LEEVDTWERRLQNVYREISFEDVVSDEKNRDG